MLYKIVASITAGLLEDQVQELIEEGWEPIGGIAIYNELDIKLELRTDTYYQAMIKR